MLGAHWFCLVPLLPFVAMFAIHRMLDLSDVMGIAPRGEREPTTTELTYNYGMVLAFYLSVLGYFVFAAARGVVDMQEAFQVNGGLVKRVRVASQGAMWFLGKVTVLATAWHVLLLWD